LEGVGSNSYPLLATLGGTLSDVLNETRINLTIDREIGAKLDKHVPWGMKAAVVRTLIGLAVDFLDRHGPAGLGFILAGEMELRLKDKGVLDVKAG